MGNQTNIIGHLENRISPPKGDNKKRLTLGPDFILSHSISGTARLPYGQPGSPGFTSRLAFIIPQSSLLQQANNKKQSDSPWALISIIPAAFQQKLGCSPNNRCHQALRYRSALSVAYRGYKSPVIIKRRLPRLNTGSNIFLPARMEGRKKNNRDAAITGRFARDKGDKNFFCFILSIP